MARRQNESGKRSRRQYVGSLAAAVSVGIAGCLGSATEEETEGSVDGPEQLRLDGEALSSTFPVGLRESETDDLLTRVHYHTEYSHWHRQPLELDRGRWRTVAVVFQNRQLDPLPVGDDERYQITLARSERTPENLVEYQITDDRVEMRGTASGSGELFVRLLADERVQWTAPPLPIRVS